MSYFILQASSISQDSASAWTSLMEGAAKWGLGIALAILLFVLLFLIIKKILNGVDSERADRNASTAEERKMFMSILQSRDLTLNNHLDHVQKGLFEVKESQTLLTKTMENVGDRIVKAIENKNKENL